MERSIYYTRWYAHYDRIRVGRLVHDVSLSTTYFNTGLYGSSLYPLKIMQPFWSNILYSALSQFFSWHLSMYSTFTQKFGSHVLKSLPYFTIHMSQQKFGFFQVPKIALFKDLV